MRCHIHTSEVLAPFAGALDPAGMIACEDWRLRRRVPPHERGCPSVGHWGRKVLKDYQGPAKDFHENSFWGALSVDHSSYSVSHAM